MKGYRHRSTLIRHLMPVMPLPRHSTGESSGFLNLEVVT